MSKVNKKFEFYGYSVDQNQSNTKLRLYCGALNAADLRDIVSVDNAVGWDAASNTWRAGGKNRTIDPKHWQSIKEFLSSSNLEGILPQALVLSVEGHAFNFVPHSQMPPIDRVTPGLLSITAPFVADPTDPNKLEPVAESDRVAWVLDGQHRIKAFRDWSMADPYPVNVVIIKAWSGTDYEDAMRHQTYELNMGKALEEDFKAAVREQYSAQIGHKAYKREIAYNWIRKDLEVRGRALSRDDVVGATNLRTPFVLKMSFVEGLIKLAFDNDDWLKNTFSVENMTSAEVRQVGKYLYELFEGARLSLGLINPNTKGTIGATPEVQAATDYWDIATNTKFKQKLLHNVGLKALVRGLLNEVMRDSSLPQSPQDVAKLMDHLRGIQWHEHGLQAKKDDWVQPLAAALRTMYRSQGTSNGASYQLRLEKKDKRTGNVVDTFNLSAHGW